MKRSLLGWRPKWPPCIVPLAAGDRVGSSKTQESAIARHVGYPFYPFQQHEGQRKLLLEPNEMCFERGLPLSWIHILVWLGLWGSLKYAFRWRTWLVRQQYHSRCRRKRDIPSRGRVVWLFWQYGLLLWRRIAFVPCRCERRSSPRSLCRSFDDAIGYRRYVLFREIRWLRRETLHISSHQRTWSLPGARQREVGS